MKLLTLKIKNFISIKDVNLDFTKFKPGVFLISGPTGSGKSTMLDAIHWALYGVTLNQQRATNSTISKTIYSDYAGDKDSLVLKGTKAKNIVFMSDFYYDISVPASAYHDALLWIQHCRLYLIKIRSCIEYGQGTYSAEIHKAH